MPAMPAMPTYPVSLPLPRTSQTSPPPAPGLASAMSARVGANERVPPPREHAPYFRRRPRTHTHRRTHSPDPEDWDDDTEPSDSASASHAGDRDRHRHPPLARHDRSSYRGMNSGDYHYDLLIDDDFSNRDSYRQFSLAFLAESEGSLRDGDVSDSYIASDDRTPSVPEELNEAAAKGVRAYTSFYTGMGEPGGHHSASIVAVHNQHRDQQPLFRWR